MGFSTSRLKLLLAWTIFIVSVWAEQQESPVDEFQDDDDQPRLTRRILEPPPLPFNDGFHEIPSPAGTLVLEENNGDRKASLIHEDSGIQYKVLNDKGEGTYEFGYDTRGSRKGARFFRHEERGTDGRVRGQYGFVDANGDLHVIIYVTDALGHRIRTETHKIEGYGHELTKILEKGSSSADVKDHINEIIRDKSSSTTSSVFGTTGRPETTTINFVRTTRSTQQPEDFEPYFDSAEPDTESSPPELSNIASLLAATDQPSPNSESRPTTRKANIPKSLDGGDVSGEGDERLNSSPQRPLTRRTATGPPSIPQGNSRFFVIHPAPAPQVFQRSQQPTFSPSLVTDLSLTSIPVQSQNPTFPTSSNIPVDKSGIQGLSPADYHQLRQYLENLQRKSSGELGETKPVDTKNFDGNIVFGNLPSLLSRITVSKGKNLAFFVSPHDIIGLKEDEDIIHGEIIDGGIINPGQFEFDDLNVPEEVIDGGLIDGGIVGDVPVSFSGNFNPIPDSTFINSGDAGNFGGNFNPNSDSVDIINGDVRNFAANFNPNFNGGVINGGEGNFAENLNFNIDSGVGINHDGGARQTDNSNSGDALQRGSLFEGVTTSEDIAADDESGAASLEDTNIDDLSDAVSLEDIIRNNENDDRSFDNMFDEAKIKNILALQELLESENAETFIGLLNLERVLLSDNIDRVSKALILDRMLESKDQSTVAKVRRLRSMMDPEINDHLEDIRNMLKVLVEGGASSAKSLELSLSDRDSIKTLKQMLSSVNDAEMQDMMLKDMQQSQSETKEMQSDLSESLEKSLEQVTANRASIIDQLIQLHKPRFPVTMNAEPIPSGVSISPKPQVEMSSKISMNKKTSESEEESSSESTDGKKSQMEEMSTDEMEEQESGKSIASSSSRGQDNNVPRIPGSVPVTNEPESTKPEVQRIPPGIITNPNEYRGPEVIYYIPAPKLSTERPDSQQPRPPVVIYPGSQGQRPQFVFDFDQDSNGNLRKRIDGTNTDNNEDGSKRSDNRNNFPSDFGFRPLSIASLSPHRSSVFINSTVYLTTTISPKALSSDDIQSHFSRPKLLPKIPRPEATKRVVNRPRLNKGKSAVPVPTRMHAERESDSRSSEDESHSSIEITENGNKIAVKSGSVSSSSESHEEAEGTFKSSGQNIPKLTPVPITRPTTLATIMANITPQPAQLVPFQQQQVQPKESAPLPPSISTLPAPPPIIINRPPIHVTTILPPAISPKSRFAVPRLTTVSPLHSRGLAHSPVPLVRGPPVLRRIPAALHGHRDAHVASSNEVQRPSLEIPDTSSQSREIPIQDHPETPPTFPNHVNQPGTRSRGQRRRRPSKQGSRHHNFSPMPHVFPNGPPLSLLAHTPSGLSKNNKPYIPIQTATVTISSGPHHVFVQQNPSRTPPRPRTDSEELNQELSIEAFPPVLPSGPPIVPAGNHLDDIAGVELQRFEHHRIQRRADRRPSHSQDNEEW